MKMRFGLGMILWLGAVVGLSMPTLGQMKPIELTYSIFFPAPHKNTILANEWAKEVEKRTQGRVKITLFPGGTLTPADKCYDGVVKGISDIGMSVLGYTRGKFPLTEVIDLPLGYKNGLSATLLVNRYYQQFKPKEFSEVKVLYFHAHGPGILHTKKPVYKLEDLKGLRIRSTGLSAKVVTALQAIPVAMPMGETYDALKRGMAEGSMAPHGSSGRMEMGGSGEIHDGELWFRLTARPFFVVMNLEKWNSLPSEIQQTVEKINQEWVEKTGKLWDEIDQSGKAFSQRLGNQIISLSREENERWAKATQPILQDYVQNMKAKGLPGEEALKFLPGIPEKSALKTQTVRGRFGRGTNGSNPILDLSPQQRRLHDCRDHSDCDDVAYRQ
jgi:TRAP-type C4-dicarboxylate transport system substrate-binding protein